MSGTFDHEDKRPHWVYRIFDASDQLLYIGCAYDVEQRLMLHHIRGHRVTKEQHPTKAEAREAERQAIQAERPLHNKQHNPTRWNKGTAQPEPPVTLAEKREAMEKVGRLLWPHTPAAPPQQAARHP